MKQSFWEAARGDKERNGVRSMVNFNIRGPSIINNYDATTFL